MDQWGTPNTTLASSGQAMIMGLTELPNLNHSVQKAISSNLTSRPKPKELTTKNNLG